MGEMPKDNKKYAEVSPLKVKTRLFRSSQTTQWHSCMRFAELQRFHSKRRKSRSATKVETALVAANHMQARPQSSH